MSLCIKQRLTKESLTRVHKILSRPGNSNSHFPFLLAKYFILLQCIFPCYKFVLVPHFEMSRHLLLKIFLISSFLIILIIAACVTYNFSDSSYAAWMTVLSIVGTLTSIFMLFAKEAKSQYIPLIYTLKLVMIVAYIFDIILSCLSFPDTGSIAFFAIGIVGLALGALVVMSVQDTHVEKIASGEASQIMSVINKAAFGERNAAVNVVVEPVSQEGASSAPQVNTGSSQKEDLPPGGQVEIPGSVREPSGV